MYVCMYVSIYLSLSLSLSLCVGVCVHDMHLRAVRTKPALKATNCASPSRGLAVLSWRRRRNRGGDARVHWSYRGTQDSTAPLLANVCTHARTHTRVEAGLRAASGLRV